LTESAYQIEPDSSIIDTEDFKEILEDAVSQSATKCREVFSLNKWEDLSNNGIT